MSMNGMDHFEFDIQGRWWFVGTHSHDEIEKTKAICADMPRDKAIGVRWTFEFFPTSKPPHA